MTQKFENFRAALVALCVEHDVHLTASMYDSLQAWDSEGCGRPDEIWLDDRTKETHDIFKDGDAGIPDCVKDRNGQVVLGLCKRCGRAECELDEPCGPREAAG